MKHKSHLLKTVFACLFLTGFIQLYAQTDPGTTNLTHQWTFDDGTAKDAVTTSPVNGILVGGATIVNKALKLSAAGQYVSFSGSSLSLKSYTAITQEIWFTPSSGANKGYTMLTYFGNTSGGQGYNYISTSAARGDDKSRTCISNGTYNSEIGANGTEYDDGKLHQMVSVIRADSVMLYIDGVLSSKTLNTIPLSTIGTTLALLGKGGYTSDPTWLGSISKFSIYNKSLSASEIKFLYQKGAESSPMLISSASLFSFDNLYKTETFNVSALNLNDTIVITAPDGITLNPSKLAPNANNASVVVTYDGTSTVNGNVTLTSGSMVVSMPVKSFTNDCYTKLYPNFTNLISNPQLSSLSSFAGWGTRAINTDPAFVYCGATSGKVSGTNAGSLDVSLTGKIVANTKYRVKARVLAIGGAFQLSVSGIGTSDFVKTIPASNNWQDIDFTFTTGATLGASPVMYFNNYALTGTSGYIDNWEMYAIPKIYTSAAGINFDLPSTKTVSVRGVNLTDSIFITTSQGFTVTPSKLPATTNGSIISVTFNYPVSVSGWVYFTSGSIQDSMQVNGSKEPTLVVPASGLLVDEINNTATFTVKAYNLDSVITFSAPAGISFSPATLPATPNGSTVTVTYDGVANSSGDINLTSGSAKAKITITAQRNDECAVPLYPGAVNLIKDPTLNSYTADGWGTKSINSDPNFVYCGARSGKVTGSGSLNRNLTGVMKPNTQYRVKAKVYKYGSRPGQNMGNVTYTLGINQNTDPGPYSLIKQAMDSACMYFSKYTPFSYDIYVYYNAGIPTAQANYHGSIGFGPNTRYQWVGTAMHEMCHWFGSGTTNEWKSKIVNGAWTGAATAALVGAGVIRGDAQHFWPYGINQREEVTNLGTIAAQQEALKMTAKVAAAMIIDDAGLPTNNTPVGVGVYGWDATKNDLYYEVKTTNAWHDVDFTFTTGNTLKATQGVFFNSGTGYIDNWEMYEVPEANGISNVLIEDFKLYVQDRQINCDFSIPAPGKVSFDIYNTHGQLVKSQSGQFDGGNNHAVIESDFITGVYLLKMNYQGNVITRKVIY